MRKLFRLIAALMLVTATIFASIAGWNTIREMRLESKVRHALLDEIPELSNENWRLFLDKNEGVIHGSLSSQALYTDVAELISKLDGEGKRSIPGLVSLENALTVPHQSSLDLAINDESGAIEIGGELPDTAMATLTAALAAAFPDADIKQSIHLSGGQVSPAPWADSLGETIPALVHSVGNLNMKLEGRALTINGEVASEEARNQVQQLLLQRFAGSIDYVRNGLNTMQPGLQAFLNIEFTGADTIVLDGRIPSKDKRDHLVRAIEAIAPAGFLVEDRLKVRPSASGCWWTRPTLAFLPTAFEALHGGEFRVDASGLQISGDFASSTERSRVQSLAASYFPDFIYAITTDSINPPESMIATTIEPVPDQPIAIVEVAEISPITEPTPAPALPSPKIDELLANTHIYFSSGSTRIRETEREKLATLAEQLASAPDIRLGISGLADPVGNASANRRLANRRCTAVLVALEESGIDPARLEVIGGGETSPAPGEPSWKLRRVEFAIHRDTPDSSPASTDWLEAVTSTQIYFEKNSTKLTLEGRTKLDRVATMLKAETPGVLGISGFTDPGGNRSYNERLSKLRCQAVQEYLVTRGVPDTRLKTQPGGELTNTDSNEPTWKKRRVQFQWIEIAAAQ